MRWIQRYHARNYIKSSGWIFPMLCMAVALITQPVVRNFDAWAGWTLLGFGTEGAKAIAAGILVAQLSFVAFIFSALLIAVQVASAQLSPRIIATTVLRDRASRIALGLFIFTFIYSLGILGRIENFVPQLSMLLLIIFSLLSIGAFLYLIDYAAKALRPITIAGKVGHEGIGVIQSVYTTLITDSTEAPAEMDYIQLGEPTRTVYHRGMSAVVLALDVNGLVSVAQQADCVIVFVPEVGDFVARDEPLFLLFQGGQKIDEDDLHDCVAFGPERTLEQDPGFAFRILVDIAAKALSPAINDPTTAVIAIDQIHRLLRLVGMRDLGDGRIEDKSGKIRLIFPTPDWEDFVGLAVSEVRLYGSGNLQITRRLRAMLENLIEVLPEQRVPALRNELNILHRFVERDFKDPEDRALADTPDYQGVGGARLDSSRWTSKFAKRK